MTALVQTWGQISHDFRLNWFVYLSMPLVAAVVGYTTKLVALQMLYRPIEYRGIGPIGWQGVVPRRAGKTAAVTIQMLTEKLLDPREILDRIDPKDAIEELREPLARAVDEGARELCEEIRPGLWDALPEAGRRLVRRRVAAAAPAVVDGLLAEVRRDMTRYVDLQFLAVTVLVRNKEQLNDLMKGLGGAAMKFIRRSGIYFGFAIGIVQMIAWGYFHTPWIMPAFGFFTGFASDWLALNLLFIPRRPVRLFGVVPIQGVLHAKRTQVTRDYARLLANDIFSVDVLLEAILSGPSAEHLLHAISREVAGAIDSQVGVVQPILPLVMGTQRYKRVRADLVERVMARVPDTVAEAKEYTAKALGIENLIVEKMTLLEPEQFEDILRPVFKDDELLMVSVGAILGFLVGELQVVLVEHLARG